MLDKFISTQHSRFGPKHAKRWRRSRHSPKSRADRARLGVIRHRVTSRLHGRRQHLAVAAVALALAGGAAAAAGVVGPDGQPAPVGIASSAAPDDTRAEREAAAERPDRSQRTQPSPTEDGAPRASDPEESPEPTPSEPAESEPEPEPAPLEEPEPAPLEEPEADWVHPLPGASTTSCYGMRWGALHAGVDLAAPNGAPIRAVGDGVVTEVGWVYGGYGISVAIDHQNGFYTHYAHAAQANVSVGQRVSAGQTIALEGSTGDSTGPHLHFEVHQGWWNQIEPTSWMRDRGVDIGGC